MTYTEQQLSRAAPFPLTQENAADQKNGQLRLKIQGAQGATNWLNITPEQARAIEQILQD
jgi:hypothetical protein